MRLTVFAGAVLLLVALSRADSDKASDWSWGADKADSKKEADASTIEIVESPKLNVTEEITGRSLGGIESHGRSLGGGEHVIDDILVSNRQGRNLDGFDDVYSDPQVQRALQSGNDSQARQYIKERLCNLGLMACDDIEVDAKSPGGYINPQEVFYAQPVAIKPVGHPIPAVPVRSQHALRPPFEGPGYQGPRPGYDGPRPGFEGPRPGYDGPRPGYDGPRPGYDGPRPGYDTVRQGFNGPRPGAGFNSGPFISSRPVPGPIYGAAKPVAPVYEPLVEPELSYIPNAKVSQVNGNGQGLQQHVHHHFHHGETNVKPVIVGSGITGASFGGLGGHGQLGQGGVNQGGLGGVNSHVHGQGGYTVLGGGNNYGAVNSLGSAGVYGGQGIGPNAPFYKKELNVRPSAGLSGNSLNPSYAGSFPSYESPRADIDCVCVPYEQCASFERKTGGQQSLIDPRNVPDKNIEAISLDDVVVTDGNGTIISYHKKREDKEDDKVEAKEEEVKETRRKRDADEDDKSKVEARQAGGRCGPRHVCCRRNAINVNHLQQANLNSNNAQCGRRHAQGINGRIKNPVYVDGDSEFGEYPWQAAILKKDAQESVYVCGGTLIDSLHVITAAHCIKTYQGGDLRVRLGEWDVNHDVEFYPYEERDVSAVHIHPDFYAGTLLNDLAILRLARPVDTTRAPHISAACLPDPRTDYSGQRCWTTGWGKDAFGDYGKYQNILKEVDVPVVSHHQCQSQLQQTRLGYEYRLNPGMICAGGEEGKDACKGDGGGPMVCEYGGTWQVVGVVSWGIGCGQYGVPGVYVKVAHYVDWIRQITRAY